MGLSIISTPDNLHQGITNVIFQIGSDVSDFDTYVNYKCRCDVIINEETIIASKYEFLQSVSGISQFVFDISDIIKVYFQNQSIPDFGQSELIQGDLLSYKCAFTEYWGNPIEADELTKVTIPALNAVNIALQKSESQSLDLYTNDSTSKKFLTDSPYTLDIGRNDDAFVSFLTNSAIVSAKITPYDLAGIVQASYELPYSNIEGKGIIPINSNLWNDDVSKIDVELVKESGAVDEVLFLDGTSAGVNTNQLIVFDGKLIIARKANTGINNYILQYWDDVNLVDIEIDATSGLLIVGLAVLGSELFVALQAFDSPSTGETRKCKIVKFDTSFVKTDLGSMPFSLSFMRSDFALRIGNDLFLSGVRDEYLNASIYRSSDGQSWTNIFNISSTTGVNPNDFTFSDYISVRFNTLYCTTFKNIIKYNSDTNTAEVLPGDIAGGTFEYSTEILALTTPALNRLNPQYRVPYYLNVLNVWTPVLGGTDTGGYAGVVVDVPNTGKVWVFTTLDNIIEFNLITQPVFKNFNYVNSAVHAKLYNDNIYVSSYRLLFKIPSI